MSVKYIFNSALFFLISFILYEKVESITNGLEYFEIKLINSANAIKINKVISIFFLVINIIKWGYYENI